MKILIITLFFGAFTCYTQVPEVEKQPNIMASYQCDPEAQYPGGTDSLKKDLSEALVYPDSAIKSGVEGRVYLEFVINTTGTISNITVLKGIGFGCDEAAIVAVKQLKQFIPAECNGEKVKQRFRLPVKFTLND